MSIRQAVRGLLRQPALTASAVLAGALGIGASAAVFSAVDRVLFRPLPYAHGGRLASVGILAPLDSHEFLFAQGYFALRRHPASPFETVTALQAGSIACDLTEANARRLRCLRVEANFLETLGAAPVLGRAFSREEDRPGAPPVALISHALWRSRYGGDPRIAGRTMPLDGLPTLIAGVLPAGFETPTLTEADVLLPLSLDEARERSGRALRAFGRLKPGVDSARAAQELEPWFQTVLVNVPERFRKEIRLRVRSVRERQNAEVKSASLALLGAVAAVLLIACANIANLMLARRAARDREMKLRAALGASRWQLARLGLAESLLLSCAGGAFGVVLAHILLRAAVTMAPNALPRLADAQVDSRVLAFALAVTVATGLLAGLAPAWRRSWRPALVAVQIAASMMLLTGAGLMLRTLWNLERVRVAAAPERVVTASFVLGRERYGRAADQLAFFNELERRLAAIPGLEAAALTDSLPPAGSTRSRPFSTLAVEGHPPAPEGSGGMVLWRYVGARYFAALGVPILRGRGFQAEDAAPDVYSMVLSEAMARKAFPGEEAVGKRVHAIGAAVRWFTVIGVAADVRNGGLERASSPEFYVLRKEAVDVVFANAEPPTGWRAAMIVARTGLDPAPAAAALRAAVQELDATIPVETATMHDRLREVTAGSRFQSLLLTVFGAIGVLLAAIGLFGVTSFLVAQRRREMGVRFALGATRAHVQWVAVRQMAAWTAAGLLAGAAASIAAARAIRTLLFGVEPLDLATLSGAATLLALVAIVSAWLPARRAGRVNPAEVLRAD